MAYKMKKSIGERIFDSSNIIFLVLFCITIIYPFWDRIILSLMQPENAQVLGLRFWPGEINFESYKEVLKGGKVIDAYMWTAYRGILGTSLTLLVSSMLAYPLAKRYLPFRNLFTALIVFTMFFSGGLIPIYLLVRRLGLMNSIWALVLPQLINAFHMIIMRNFFMSLPEELDESARIDGASNIRILVSIILPISKPILATVGLWTIVFHWNSWFDAMIYITGRRITVLQILLRRVLLEGRLAEGFASEIAMMEDQQRARPFTPDTLRAAILMVTTLPILAVYPFIQKYFVKGIMIGSLKG